MTDEQRFTKLLSLLAKRCNYELDAFEATLIARDLKPLGWDLVNLALERFYVSMKGGERFPSINELRQKCVRLAGIEGELNATPRELAERLWQSTARFGSADVERAKNFVGEDGWALVDRMGGWHMFKDGLLTEQREICLSQWTKALTEIVGTGGDQLRLAPPKAVTFIEAKLRPLTEGIGREFQ